MADQTEQKLYQQLENALPSLRRYARSLLGNQESGDALVVVSVEQFLLTNPKGDQDQILRQLFQAFHSVWVKKSHHHFGGLSADEHRTQSYLEKLTPLSREALLLHAIEEFSHDDIAAILSVDQPTVETLLATAIQEMKAAMSGRILVIEDEAIIAMDLQDILQGIGHDVIGAAATHDQAVALAEIEKPDLILADIQLADGSSGVEAVDEILTSAGEIPVIFITAYPERLLTGKRKEPAFVITKPYDHHKVMSAVGQAMFFATTNAIEI